VGNALEAMWDHIQSWANANAEQYIAAQIPTERTDATGPDTALVPMRDYFRLWLADMFLSKSRKWFTTEYPAVHSSVSLKFGPAPVKISHVTGAPEGASRGVKVDYALTDLLPFNGGTVEIQCGLIALKGVNYAAETIGILKDFSGLVGAPLTPALTIAEKVSNGMQKLSAGSDVALGFHKQFRADGGRGGGNVLRPGYTAVILATPSQVDVSRLSVKGSRLHYAEKPGAPPMPLVGYDYMLFFIESRPDRDNWRMPNIEEPLNQAIQATIAGKADEADGFKKAALMVVWQSPDLAVQDRRRVADAIEAELKEIAGPRRGATAAGPRTLDEIMEARAMPIARALSQPPLTLAEILGE
jgi:hypothetical protein